jgi:hypothetical protein
MRPQFTTCGRNSYIYYYDKKYEMNYSSNIHICSGYMIYILYPKAASTGTQAALGQQDQAYYLNKIVKIVIVD